MYKILWAIVGLAALALGTAVFGGVVDNNDVHNQSAKISAIMHQESVDRTEIASLQAQVKTLLATRSGAP